MARSLPAKPNLERLKKEAKAVLKAHRKKNGSCCAVLAHLPAFNGASEKDILAEELQLSQVQHAVALEYGYASWGALRNAVEGGAPRAFQLEVDKVRIKGLLGWQGKASAISCLVICLKHMGVKTSYEELMGLGSQAFFLHMRWGESASLRFFGGFNTEERALSAHGFGLTRYPLRVSRQGGVREQELRHQSAAFLAVRESIDRGMPGILDWEEAQILPGYAKSGSEVAGLLDARGNIIEHLPPSITLIRQRKRPRDRSRSLILSLKEAVAHAHSDNVSIPSGFTAWKNWIDGLFPGARPIPDAAGSTKMVGFDDIASDKREVFRKSNARMYDYLVDARKAACIYLRSIADELPIGSALLKEAGNAYGKVVESLEEGWKHILYPWWLDGSDPWPQKHRTGQAAALAEALTHEKSAIAEIEKAIALFESHGI